jgi:hypothetical protein
LFIRDSGYTDRFKLRWNRACVCGEIDSGPSTSRPGLRDLGMVRFRSATRLSLLSVPVLNLCSGPPDGIRGRVIGLDREYLAIGRDLGLRDRLFLPLKQHNRDRVMTIDLSDLHRLARRHAVD